MTQHNLFISTGAIFSDCGCYRYLLSRDWDTSKTICVFIMLNPSTANDIKNDPTIERCQRRVRGWSGFGQLRVVNLFAHRATNPKEMMSKDDPTGPENDHYILENAKMAQAAGGKVICAWGNHGGHRGRSREVVSMLRNEGVRLYHLGINNTGEPKHPLYINYEVEPVEWK